MNSHTNTDLEWSIHPPLPNFVYQWRTGHDPITPEEVNAFFYSDGIEVIKQRICSIGRRLWQKEYVDGNGGNISVRVGDNLVLCTPTLISKGFMAPQDICLVDMNGKQKAGIRPSTSEIKTHLAIMKKSGARSCVHAHPANANAFLVTGSVPPTGIMPEPDIFFGEVGLAAYATPGSEQNAHNVGETSRDHQCIFMENHGVIVWGDHVEDAYWKLENVDAYCRILLLATALQEPITRVDAASMRDFINIRRSLGMPDPRAERSDSELFTANEFAGKPLKTR